MVANSSSLDLQRRAQGVGPQGPDAPAAPAPAPALPDVLCVLDMCALVALCQSLSERDLANARLACRALRNAVRQGVRQLTVSVSQSLAQNWRPGQRSPLSLFPWCEDVSISVDTNIWDTSRSSDGESSDDDEGEAGEGYGDSGYGHHHTARLALAGVSAQALGRIRRLTIVNDYDSRRGFDLEAVVCTFVPQLPGLEVLDANDVRQLEGMEAADRARPTMIYQALAQHCPRLR
ncbi:hypothetical protein CHLRE_07g319226v5 [Chlamydomonas reinhardtii]|uniref:F-box domain-containing protein n=1 Tax=Chlamydomonas reinhardtii TaxID=3055 RepID=A0A2K3DIX9_CHLRE|nr:uncharacterized protein CHLRE_07g319226v5 [Chlamydomonas reinhardtii]PNW80480.1 hypothetical protein CHLRE_07g319226v5 [Chlamydomonas reinhardtii]